MNQAIETTCERIKKVKEKMNELKAFRQVLSEKLDKTDERLLKYIAEYQELIQMKYSFEFKIIEDAWADVQEIPGPCISSDQFLNLCDSIFDGQQ